MAKGIIVVDKVPENCRNIMGEKEKDCPYGGMECKIAKKDAMEHVKRGTKPDWCPIKPVPLALACNKLIEELNKKEDFYSALRAGIINSIKDPDTMSYPETENIADKIIKRITGD